MNTDNDGSFSLGQSVLQMLTAFYLCDRAQVFRVSEPCGGGFQKTNSIGDENIFYPFFLF